MTMTTQEANAIRNIAELSDRVLSLQQDIATLTGWIDDINLVTAETDVTDADVATVYNHLTKAKLLAAYNELSDLLAALDAPALAGLRDVAPRGGLK